MANPTGVDKRDTTKVYVGGSDLLQVKLAAGEYEAASTAGWYTLSYLAGGQVGEDYETEQIFSEGGVLVRTKVNREEALFENTVLQTDTATLKLLKTLAETAHMYRYFLPAEDGTENYQVFAMYKGLADKNSWRVGTAQGEIRQRPFIIRGSVDELGNPKLIIADVTDITNEAGWPAELADFLSA